MTRLTRVGELRLGSHLSTSEYCAFLVSKRDSRPDSVPLSTGPDAGLGLVVGRVLRVLDLSPADLWIQLLDLGLLRRVP